MSFSPRFQITNKIAQSLTTIERARGFLAAARLSNEWIKQMQDRALVLEAYYTTHIEGTQLTLEQSEQLLEGKEVPHTNSDDVKELLNYRQAFELVADYLDSGELIIESLVREIHKRLVIGVRGNSAAPGEYRKIQNYVVNSKTGNPIYTPPAAFEVPLMMSELTKWINTEEAISPILVAGIAQFQFVHIHPFLDGNGRTGRLLSTLCLYRKGYDFKRLFTISGFYDRDRANYYRAIQSVRDNDMDMTDWIEYFTRGLSTQMEAIRMTGEQVIKLDIIKNKHKLNLRQQGATNYIVKHGSLTIKDYESIYPGVNRRTLQRELKALVNCGIIKPEGATNQLVYKLPV
jgi:cell filamentation protein, protein adenylyltransferase